MRSSTESDYNGAIRVETPLKVLVVDDEVENLELVERSLFPKFDVQGCPDPNRALDAIREQSFAVVISDHRMPGMTGVELLSQVSAIAPDCVRILLTAYADLDTALDAVNRGRVSAILRKPMDAITLPTELDRVLSHYRLVIENRALNQELAQRNKELADAKHMLELDLDARSKELLEANQRLEQMAVRDGLTGLYNHRYFQDRCAEEVIAAIDGGHPISLIFVDVDHFSPTTTPTVTPRVTSC